MKLSPRERRLHTDNRAIIELDEESSIFEFDCSGNPPDKYRVVFNGRGIWRSEDGTVRYGDRHEVLITLTSAYPRMMPELAWQTPIFHPNISAGGIVCLGGYGTHWVPSLKLDELCHMLWDMIRYKNFDVESPYNREAAVWARLPENTSEYFPVDRRPLRDRVAVGQINPLRDKSSGSIGEFEGVEFIESENGDLIDGDSFGGDSIDGHSIGGHSIGDAAIDRSIRQRAQRNDSSSDRQSSEDVDIMFID